MSEIVQGSKVAIKGLDESPSMFVAEVETDEDGSIACCFWFNYNSDFQQKNFKVEWLELITESFDTAVSGENSDGC